MLRIAIPNKGGLAGPADNLLKEAGYRGRRSDRELVSVDEENGIEFFYLRARDIAVYVGAGTVDAGITGRDLMLDSGVTAVEHRTLGFGRSTFRFAAPAHTATSLEDINGKRVATSYARVVDTYLKQHGISAEVIRLDGAIESTVHLGVADLVADVVETGATLRAAGLDVFGDPILESEAVLIRRSGSVSDALKVLDRRIKSVKVARRYVMMDYDVPSDLVNAAVAITPGLESPTVSPLHSDGWVAVRAMVDSDATHRVMDQLYDLGARAILVTSIHACRL